MNTYTVVDVRRPDEYAEGCVEGSINIPLETLFDRLDDFKELKQPIYLYCRSGNRSGQALQILKDAIGLETTNIGGLEEAKMFCEKLQ